MSPDEIEKLKENTDPLVKALLEEFLEYTTDPTKRFFVECSQMLNVISEDFKTLREINKDDAVSAESGVAALKILGSNKDDKLFERILAVLNNAGKIGENIKILRGDKPKSRKNDTETDEIPA